MPYEPQAGAPLVNLDSSRGEAYMVVSTNWGSFVIRYKSPIIGGLYQGP